MAPKNYQSDSGPDSEFEVVLDDSDSEASSEPSGTTSTAAEASPPAKATRGSKQAAPKQQQAAHEPQPVSTRQRLPRGALAPTHLENAVKRQATEEKGAAGDKKRKQAEPGRAGDAAPKLGRPRKQQLAGARKESEDEEGPAKKRGRPLKKQAAAAAAVAPGRGGNRVVAEVAAENRDERDDDGGEPVAGKEAWWKGDVEEQGAAPTGARGKGSQSARVRPAKGKVRHQARDLFASAASDEDGQTGVEPADTEAPESLTAPAQALAGAKTRTAAGKAIAGAGQRSPTPVAAAAVLEMSQPASPARGSSAEAEAAGQAQDPSYAANTWLMARLHNLRGPEAQEALLRPQLQAVHDRLLTNLESTIELGHNNSMLVLGPRGSGKSLVVERAVGAICAKYNTHARDPLVGVVRLVGYAHADDRVAFREIARQLCEGFQYTFSKTASISENIDFLRDVLRQLSKAEKVAVFVLDEFDLFARRSKQAVLYNLLDALQTSGMQAAVIGVTPRQDVIEMLEKRVKSRFSHRKLDVTLPTAGAARQVAAPGGGQHQEDGMMDVLKSMLLLPSAFPDQHHALRFNGAIESAVAAPEVAAALEQALPTSPTLNHMAIVVEAALRASYRGNGLVTARQLVEAIQQLQERQRDNVLAVSQLSVLELILLAAMQRLAAKTNGEALNFEMVHHEFRGYSAQGGHADNYSKGAAAKAFDHLISLGLVAYVDARNEGRAGVRQYAAVYLQVRGDEVEQGMREHWNCPPLLPSWMLRQGGAGNTAATVLL